MSENRRKDRGICFSKRNPPPSREVAEERIEKLTATIGRVEVELDHTGVGEFDTYADYIDWRGRALGAVGHYKGEVKFLEIWLNPPPPRPEPQPRTPDPVRVTQAFEAIKQRAEELAQVIERDYSPVYSVDKRPVTIQEARDRLVVTTAVHQRWLDAQAEISDLWAGNPLRKKGLSGGRMALQRISSAITAERSLLKECIRTFEQELATSNWHATVVAALNRAMDGGFKLTADEMYVLERLEKYVGIRRERPATTK